MNILTFAEHKRKHEKLVMVTCYDYTAARIVAQADIDMILVGDSAAMVMHGHDSTLPISTDEMAMHVRAVRRGAPKTFIVGDLPFLSYRRSQSETMDAVARLMRAGAEAVKLEGIAGNAEIIRHIVDSGVPVMGHIGLTPQSVNQLGGFRVQGVEADDRERLKREAVACQEAGCFALVLECVPETLAAEITSLLKIPTIGIGAGAETDGQVLVMHDLLGLNLDFKPKFVRRYLDGNKQWLDAFNQYASDVRSGEFPASEERYAG
ncbi:3-methyl-2-oxobutanoate hydroxymethyltransferase [Elongatibacter sediminis]|uniref:3-methyl-2-oxobutanoate hydroxymethyltransferase n=1 Tax=Elongatibacter sediminis TaxID=3119006 RepID=A0AAW9RBZ7_9GAMM